MERTEYESYTELSAGEGMVLTQYETEERVFAHKVSTPNPDAWEEWTEQQKDEYLNPAEVDDDTGTSGLITDDDEDAPETPSEPSEDQGEEDDQDEEETPSEPTETPSEEPESPEPIDSSVL